MDDGLFVNKLKGFDHLEDVDSGLKLHDSLPSFYELLECIERTVLENDVNIVVIFKYFNESNNVLMLKHSVYLNL